MVRAGEGGCCGGGGGGGGCCGGRESEVELGSRHLMMVPLIVVMVVMVEVINKGKCNSTKTGGERDGRGEQ